MKEFHNQLKYAMSEKNITQKELCEKTGIPKSAMSQYISGAFKPKQKRTYLIAKALQVNVAWLMGYDVPMEEAKNNAEQIYYDLVGINTTLSEFPITDVNVLNTATIMKSLQKTMEINKMFLSTPRLYLATIEVDEAIIGLKFILAYYNINFQDFDENSLEKIIDSDLFKDFIKNIIKINIQNESSQFNE